MSIESVMLSNHLILCCPLLLLSSIFSSIRVFSNVMSQLFTSGGQSIGASASVLPINIQHWFPLGWTGLISFQSKGLSRVFSNTTVQKHQFFSAQPSLWSNSHTHTWLLEKPTIVGKVVSLLFNIPSRVVIAFLPRSKCPLISWLQSPSAVILEPKKIKFVTVYIVSSSILHEVMGPDAVILVFQMLRFIPQGIHTTISLSSLQK